MELFFALGIALLPSSPANVHITPVVSASTDDRAYTTTTAFRNDGPENVQCESVYSIPNDPNHGSLRGNYVINSGEVLVEEDTLMAAAAVGTLRFECSGAVHIAAKIQESTDGGKTFDSGRMFWSVGEQNPITART